MEENDKSPWYIRFIPYFIVGGLLLGIGIESQKDYKKYIRERHGYYNDSSYKVLDTLIFNSNEFLD